MKRSGQMRESAHEAAISRVQRIVNYLTLVGFIGTVSVVAKFLSSTPYIRLENTGIWGITIQGVPFVWIVSSITLLNTRNFYNALKGIADSSFKLAVLLAIVMILIIASL